MVWQDLTQMGGRTTSPTGPWRGVLVCQGYAEAFKLLMEAAG